MTNLKSSLFLIAACTAFHFQLYSIKEGNIYQRISESALFLLCRLSSSSRTVLQTITVRLVIYRGSVKRDFIPLPGARKEAETIARRLGVWPLLGEHATKPAVLERIFSPRVSYILLHMAMLKEEKLLLPFQSPLPGFPKKATTF